MCFRVGLGEPAGTRLRDCYVVGFSVGSVCAVVGSVAAPVLMLVFGADFHEPVVDGYGEGLKVLGHLSSFRMQSQSYGRIVRKPMGNPSWLYCGSFSVSFQLHVSSWSLWVRRVEMSASFWFWRASMCSARYVGGSMALHRASRLILFILHPSRG